MPAEAGIFSGATLLAFLLVLTRVAGIFVFLPLPGFRQGPELPRVCLAVGFTLALFSRWPHVAGQPSIGQLTVWIASEAALGLTIGLAVSFAMEGFLIAMQVTGMQAGYGYASMINPATDADSSVLVVIAQLFSGLLFFALGLEHETIRVLARTLETYPPGGFALSRPAAQAIAGLGAEMFSAGLRLALPGLALLVMVDLALALLGRLNAQLQLVTLAFPVKMLATLAVLAWTAVLFPRVLAHSAGSMLSVLQGAIGR